MEQDIILYLCNFDDNANIETNEILSKIWSNKWTLDDENLCKDLFSTNLELEQLNDFMQTYQSRNELNKILHIAINCYLNYCEHNWNPHPEELNLAEYFNKEWPKNIDVNLKMQRDSEPIYANILYPELLYFSHQLFSSLYTVDQSLLHLWWIFRCKVTHQRCLEDTSASLYSELEHIIAKLCNELQGQLKEKPRLQILLCLEIAQAYLIYGRVQKVEEYLLRARETAGLKLELTGIMGKRTKFQEQSLPQLALSSELDANVERPSAEESHGNTQLPPDLELQDDVRLNNIEYAEMINQPDLPSLEQILCLLTVQYIQKSQPKDDLMVEELQPYIVTILSQKNGAWSTRVAALLIRCKLEASHKRTVERAMLQCETLVNDKTCTLPTTRLSYLFASGLAPAWTWRQQLADLYLSLGLVKAALEEYQKLQLWEDVIACYTLLQLRHKAAEIIQQQIDIKPTVKLYCLLGDATDDVKWYEKAWNFSNHKSSRAQRHWGNYLFSHKKYEECIPHYEKSVEINSIQEQIWLRLGFAALETEQWALSAKAYRRYTYLQPNTFEAWNNLAKVYVKQGDKKRAYRALMEALKFNYDNWKLWENVMLVSIDTCHYDDVIRSVHRILDLQHKFEDLEVLSLLVHVINTDAKDADGNSAARLRKRALELFGRITSVHQNKPELWQLYSDISPTCLLKGQRLLRAYRGFALIGNWPHNRITCIKVIEIAKSILEYSLRARQEVDEKHVLEANQLLASARLTGQAVIRAAQREGWVETVDALTELRRLYDKVTNYMIN